MRHCRKSGRVPDRLLGLRHKGIVHALLLEALFALLVLLALGLARVYFDEVGAGAMCEAWGALGWPSRFPATKMTDFSGCGTKTSIYILLSEGHVALLVLLALEFV